MSTKTVLRWIVSFIDLMEISDMHTDLKSFALKCCIHSLFTEQYRHTIFCKKKKERRCCRKKKFYPKGEKDIRIPVTYLKSFYIYRELHVSRRLCLYCGYALYEFKYRTINNLSLWIQLGRWQSVCIFSLPYDNMISNFQRV